MSTSTRAAGSKLKDRINANDAIEDVSLSTIFNEELRGLEEYSKPLEVVTLKTIAAYMRQSNKVCHSGTIIEALYRHLGEKNWSSNLYEYRSLSLDFLTIVNDPSISNKLAETLTHGDVQRFCNMIRSHVDFLETLEDSFKPFLRMAEIVTNGMGDEQMTTLQTAYQALLELSLSGIHPGRY